MNSCATWRLNAALWERCLVMAFILRKPSTDGQSQSFIMSTPRGALQSRVSFGCRLTPRPLAELSSWRGALALRRCDRPHVPCGDGRAHYAGPDRLNRIPRRLSGLLPG